ncbi:MAG: hypothetical protein K0M50_06430 [Prolixibacteraceae bacterium]|nr:hypothetical protein [Prolixibacteraceae bacterium]
MDKVDIEGFLNNLTQDKRDVFEKFFVPEYKFIMETKILKGKKYDNEILPERKIFKANIYNRVLLTCFGGGIFTFIGFEVIKESSVIVAVIMWLIALFLVIYVWVDKYNNTLELNSLGIIHNKGHQIDWSRITSTHILYVERGPQRDNDSYLMIGFKDGTFLKKELTKINFSGNIFLDAFSNDEKVLGHYIERYKVMDIKDK